VVCGVEQLYPCRNGEETKRNTTSDIGWNYFVNVSKSTPDLPPISSELATVVLLV
jgi:hypothetical protein